MNVGEALQEIEKAKQEGNLEALKSFEDDDRKTVQEAVAKAALEIEENAEAKQVMEDLSKPKKKVDQSGWIDASPQDIKKYQKEGILVGHDPLTGKCLLKQ